MNLSDVLNPHWLDASSLQDSYLAASPFPHIVMREFIRPDVLKTVADEFPDLSKSKRATVEFKDSKQIKFASRGMELLTPAAIHLNSYLQSDLMLKWLKVLTGIEETLISDPYLSGGGYHEIKRGGLLKVHADFNKHPKLELDRRLNLLIYLNQDWEDDWGGGLQLFGEDMATAVQTVQPNFNTAVIFTTTSYTFHGHPDPLKCPEDRSRRSLAYYYFSSGRPIDEVSAEKHSTIFKERIGEKFKTDSLLKDITPPVIARIARRIVAKRSHKLR